MLHLRALIVAIAVAAGCSPQSDPAPLPAAAGFAPAPDPTPQLCSTICSSNTECRTSINLCKYCNFGSCSQTLPEATIERLTWISARIRALPDAASPQATEALQLLDELIVRAQRTAAEP